MLKILPLLAYFFLCPKIIIAQLTQTQTIIAAGFTRTYIVHVPPGVNKPPLVLNMHGQGGSAVGMQSNTKMDLIADREKFIVVYPNAITTNGQDHSWDYFGAKEFAFLLAIVDTLDHQFKIDRNRIYSMGFSQGGVMSFHLACRYSQTFAAIAPTSQYLWDTICKPKRPVPMRLAFGTKDFAPTKKFMETVDKWLSIDSCARIPIVTSPYPSSNPKSSVTRLTYRPCASGSEVVVDSIKGGTHQWQMDTNTMFNNSEESWAFLKKFALNLSPNQVQGKEGLRFNGISAFYNSGLIQFRGLTGSASLTVLDTRFRKVLTATVHENRFEFRQKPSGVYMVILHRNKESVATKFVVP